MRYLGKTIGPYEEVFHGRHYVFNEHEIVRCTLDSKHAKCLAKYFLDFLKEAKGVSTVQLQEYDEGLWNLFYNQDSPPSSESLFPSFTTWPGVQKNALFELWKIEAKSQEIALLLFYYDYMESEYGVLPLHPPFYSMDELMEFAQSNCWRITGVWKNPSQYHPTKIINK